MQTQIQQLLSQNDVCIVLRSVHSLFNPERHLILTVSYVAAAVVAMTEVSMAVEEDMGGSLLDTPGKTHSLVTQAIIVKDVARLGHCLICTWKCNKQSCALGHQTLSQACSFNHHSGTTPIGHTGQATACNNHFPMSRHSQYRRCYSWCMEC